MFVAWCNISPNVNGPFANLAMVVGSGGLNVVTVSEMVSPPNYFRLAATAVPGPVTSPYSRQHGRLSQLLRPPHEPTLSTIHFANLQLQDAIPYAPDGTVVPIFNGTGYDTYYFDELFMMWLPTGAVILPPGREFRFVDACPVTLRCSGEVFQ